MASGELKIIVDNFRLSVTVGRLSEQTASDSLGLSAYRACTYKKDSQVAVFLRKSLCSLINQAVGNPYKRNTTECFSGCRSV